MEGTFDPNSGFELETDVETRIQSGDVLGEGMEAEIQKDVSISEDLLSSFRNGAPDWGKVKPEQEYEYTDRDGNTLFFVGRFVYPGTTREDLRPMYFNGKDWMRKVPPSFGDSLPILNLIDIYAPTLDGKANTKDIVICQDEKAATMLHDFFLREELPYIATSWFGGAKVADLVNFEPLEGRSIVVWMNNNRDSEELALKVVSLLSGISENAKVVQYSQSDKHNLGPLDYIEADNFRDIIAIIGGASQVSLGQPEVTHDRYGFSNLEGHLPLGFVRDMVQKHGKRNPRTGKRFLDSDYITAMKVISDDPAFKDLCKFDEDISSLIWDTGTYPTIDDLKNGILRRLAQYGMIIGSSVREDVIASMASDKTRKINSIKNFFEKLCEEYPDVTEKVLDEFVNKIDFKEVDPNRDPFGSNKKMFKKVLKMFFTKATLLVYTSGSKYPVPNDCCPVLVGDQGTGKSRLCRYISLDSSRFFVDLGNKSAAFGSPDWVRLIQGKLIGELGEMSVYKKVDVETVKSGISEVYDMVIPKFKEGARKYPRLTSMIGTSNEPDFLKDLTGNRRFFPIIIGRVSEELLSNPEIIRKVWAYFYSMARAVMNPEFNPEQIVPAAMVVVPKDVEDYYAKVREHSTDIGLVGDMIRGAIEKLEAKIWNEAKNNNATKYVSFNIIDVAAEVYDQDPSRATFDFKKKAKYILGTMGYQQNIYNKNGISTRGFSIETTDPAILIRVGEIVAAEQSALDRAPLGSPPVGASQVKEMKKVEVRDDIF